jgi:hypothetical protein
VRNLPIDDHPEFSGEELRSPAQRVVILGASNAAIGISDAIESGWRTFGQPLDIMSAMGFGRSYGKRSCVLGRSLVGILDCGLWQDLAERPPTTTTAVVMDIGNDLIYEQPVQRVVEWIEACLTRLAPRVDRLIVTELPIESIRQLSRWRFLLMRTMLVPTCRLDLRTMIERAVRLNSDVVERAARYGARVVRASPRWYGFDPIHVRRRYREDFWEKIFQVADVDVSIPRERLSVSEKLLLRRLRPMHYSLLGRQQTARQPAGRLRDGSLVWCY